MKRTAITVGIPYEPNGMAHPFASAILLSVIAHPGPRDRTKQIKFVTASAYQSLLRLVEQGDLELEKRKREIIQAQIENDAPLVEQYGPLGIIKSDWEPFSQRPETRAALSAFRDDNYPGGFRKRDVEGDYRRGIQSIERCFTAVLPPVGLLLAKIKKEKQVKRRMLVEARAGLIKTLATQKGIVGLGDLHGRDAPKNLKRWFDEYAPCLAIALAVRQATSDRNPRIEDLIHSTDWVDDAIQLTARYNKLLSHIFDINPVFLPEMKLVFPPTPKA